MFMFLTALTFAEETTDAKISERKSKQLRIGVCGGLAHCHLFGIEVSNPQTITKNLGTKASFGPVGGGVALTYSFDTIDKAYDHYLSVGYMYSWTDGGFMPSLNYGAYWRMNKDLPLFLDFQVGVGYLSAEETPFPSASLSLLWGFF